jgi:hypothetical protein
MEMASTSSRSPSSRSPSPRSPIFPVLPAYSNPQVATQDPDSFFNFSLDDEFKDVNVAPHTNLGFGDIGAYDFLNALSSSTSSDSGSPISSLTSSSSTPFPPDSSPSQLFTIDPQLVGTPSTSKDMSEFGGEEIEEEDGEEEEEEIIQPVKVAGYGKLRKGTVQSGGISKSVTISASRNKENAVVSQVVKRTNGEGKGEEDDDWRPTPEEYKKMSSKEKRQLRNKISARNFRVRRKGVY